MWFHIEILLYILCIFCIIFQFLKSKVPIYKGTDRLDGKTVIITGADSGIGFYCAKDFAKRGANLIITSNDIYKGEQVKRIIINETGNENIKMKYLEYTDLTNVRKCAYEILDEVCDIHILLNNAGALKIGIYQTIDDLDALTQINYYGPFLFTNILLGRLKKSTPSRIVNVSSIAQKLVVLDLYKFKMQKRNSEWLLYADSKFAVTAFTNELARRLHGTGVTVNSLHPGAFFSGIVRNLPNWKQTLWMYISKTLCNNVEEASQTSIYLCVSPDVRNISGEYFEGCQIASPPEKTRNVEFCKELWKLSEEAVGLTDSDKHY